MSGLKAPITAADAVTVTVPTLPVKPNPVIDVSGDKAKGSWRFLMVYSHIDGSFVRIIGHYEDKYVRRGGKWYFQSLIAHVEESGRYLEKEL